MEACQLVVARSCSRMEVEEEAFFRTRELSASPASSPGPTLPWSGGLDSVRERRERFLRSMALEFSPSPQQVDSAGTMGDVDGEEEEKIVPEIGILSSQSDENDCSMSSWSMEETTIYEDGVSDDNSVSGSSKDDGSKVGRSFSSLLFIQRLMSPNGKPSGAPNTLRGGEMDGFEGWVWGLVLWIMEGMKPASAPLVVSKLGVEGMKGLRSVHTGNGRRNCLQSIKDK